MTTSPEPFGVILISPLVSVDEIVFRLKSRLSTFNCCNLELESVISAELAFAKYHVHGQHFGEVLTSNNFYSVSSITY